MKKQHQKSETPSQNEDIFGKAIIDYFEGNYTEDIIVSAPDFDDDVIPVPYLFRSHADMPLIERKALQLVYGKTLDVGCGAGSHSLYLQERAIDVTGIDISAGATAVCIKRGLNKVITGAVLDLKDGPFDTIVFLMNGSGIIEKLANIPNFLDHLKTLLAPNGQILIDSSNIAYIFEEEDGGFWIDTTKAYYGEMQYKLAYKNQVSDWFDWLYVDFDTLQNSCASAGWKCELLLEGDHYDYLAKLSIPI